MRLLSVFWVTVTVVLSVIFTALFFPMMMGRYGVLPALLLTALGLMVIWAVYFVRAIVFTQMESTRVRGRDQTQKD